MNGGKWHTTLLDKIIFALIIIIFLIGLGKLIGWLIDLIF